MEMQHATHQHDIKQGAMMYEQLLIMLLLAFEAMCLFMYALVDRWAIVLPNINQFYVRY